MQVLKNIEREEGQGLVEYALILVLVAVVVIIILTILGSAVLLVFARVVGGLNGDTIDDNAVFLTADSSGLNSSCSGQLRDIKFVLVDANGDLIKNQTKTATLIINNNTTSTVAGKSDANGLFTSNGAVPVFGPCPQTFTMRYSP